MNESVTTQENTIFVGLPCYNRPDGLSETIASMRGQSHQNWRLLICDNASPNPEVRRVAEKAMRDDSRIQYHRQEKNLGAAENFRFAALQADQSLFMWASDDDVWNPRFMAKNLEVLSNSPRAQLAFGSVTLINRGGTPLFSHDGFSRFTSSGSAIENARRYLEDPEKCGKANMFYGLFRTDALKQCIENCWDDAWSNFYAADFVFLFAFFCRFEVATHDERHLLKRQPTDAKRKIRWRHIRSYRVVKSSEFESYVFRHRVVAPTVEFADLAETILRRRQSERFMYYVPFLGSWYGKRNSQVVEKDARGS